MSLEKSRFGTELRKIFIPIFIGSFAVTLLAKAYNDKVIEFFQTENPPAKSAPVSQSKSDGGNLDAFVDSD